MKYFRIVVGVCSFNGLFYVVGGECVVSVLYDDIMYVRYVECYDSVVN